MAHGCYSCSAHLEVLRGGLVHQLAAAEQGVHDQRAGHLLLVEEPLDQAGQDRVAALRRQCRPPLRTAQTVNPAQSGILRASRAVLQPGSARPAG